MVSLKANNQPIHCECEMRQLNMYVQLIIQQRKMLNLRHRQYYLEETSAAYYKKQSY